MTHPRARTVREEIERPGVRRPLQDHLRRSLRRARARCRSGRAVSTGGSGSCLSRFIRAGALFSVNLRGSIFPFTSLLFRGIETVAPATGGALNGPAIVLPYPV